MTDTHEEYSQGRDVKFCCAIDAYANIETAAGTGWDRGQRLSDSYDLAVDGRVIAVARALGIDPHALDDNVQDRGWEYHDRGIERAIAQGVYALLHPEDDDLRDEIIVESRATASTHAFRVNSRGNCLTCGGSRLDMAHVREDHHL